MGQFDRRDSAFLGRLAGMRSPTGHFQIDLIYSVDRDGYRVGVGRLERLDLVMPSRVFPNEGS
jgi:hypothetical protein